VVGDGDLLSCQLTVHTKLQTTLSTSRELLAVNVKNVLKIAFMHRFFSSLFGVEICWHRIAHLPYIDLVAL